MNLSKPLIMFRIGWMGKYVGPDEIVGGGAHINEYGEGGEMWNFQDDAGWCYGFVMTKGFAGIDLGRIMPEKTWQVGAEGRGIDIVYFSTDSKTDQNQRQVIVGWYRDATIFHKEYRTRKASNKQSEYGYLAEVDSERAILLPPHDRKFPIKRGKGYPGQSNVWYGDNGTMETEKFKEEVRDYIDKHNHVEPALVNGSKNTNRDDILAIERAAVSACWDHYVQQGYVVKSVEKDNVGWDLEATKGSEKLFIEVKGHKGNTIQFELTPNEYDQMQSNAQDYRVCVVRDALKTPYLTELRPEKVRGAWVLVETNGGKVVRLEERIAAKAVQNRSSKNSDVNSV